MTITPNFLIEDTRVNCLSLITNCSVRDYLTLINAAYKSNGGIEGQREPLKTGTAIRIRKRMIEDLKRGALLPSLVLGLTVSEDTFNNIKNSDLTYFLAILPSIDENSISIIDGMQRTAALISANEDNGISDHIIRIEFWIAKETASLVYRMLVLNTSQIPWNLRRQLEVVFKSMVCEIQNRTAGLELILIDSNTKRSKCGQFHANRILELLFIFATRQINIDLKDQITDIFTKQDFTDSFSSPIFITIFCNTLSLLIHLDNSIQKASYPELRRFKNGLDLFESHPACVGLIYAIAVNIYGRPGAREKNQEEYVASFDQVKNKIDLLINKMAFLDDNRLKEFVDFSTLEERLNQKTGKVGEYERDLFKNAFKVLLEDAENLESLTPCWRAENE